MSLVIDEEKLGAILTQSISHLANKLVQAVEDLHSGKALRLTIQVIPAPPEFCPHCGQDTHSPSQTSAHSLPK